MDWNRYRNFLLSSIYGSQLKNGGKEINCKCRECSDSANPKSMHMYISIPSDNGGEPSLYNCFKCGASGIVTHNKLIEWGIFDIEIADELVKYNKGISLLKKNTKYFSQYKYHIRNTYTNEDAKSEQKRQYINSRIGVDLNFAQLRDLKICVNLLDILKDNNITELTRDSNIIDDLDREFIGFISVDNAFMNMRRTCEKGKVHRNIDTRYVNYKIFDSKFDTEQRFYTVPTIVDMNKPERIKLHIAEGPFDVLSVYLNLRHREEGIYTSITGNNPIVPITYFLNICMTPWIEIHYYADNDKFGSIDRIRYLMGLLPDKFPIYYHMNNTPGEKDFGVPLDRIDEKIIMI